MKLLLKLFMLMSLFVGTLTLHAEGEMFVAPLPSVTLPSTKLQAIRLDMLNIETEIIGNIAQTTYEMGFYNPNARVLEGDLKMPLLEGQSVVGYALEINGKYRNAVVVNKAKAKESFENTIRQNIDPAIMEKSLGNNYKLRLYPIPSKGIKKVKVTVEELLFSKNGNFQYMVPFVSDDKISDFSLSLKVLSQKIPKIQGFLDDVAFSSSSMGYFLEYKKENVELNKAIRLEIPRNGKSSNYFQHAKNDDNWFMSLMEKKQKSVSQKKMPKSIEIIWDSSLTLVNRNLEKELNFLDALFKKVQNCKVSLKRLDIKMHDEEGMFSVKNGEWKDLKKYLRSVQYNGAKDLSKLKLSSTADEVWFFSNGVNTFSESLATYKAKNLITINSSLVADHNNLKYLSPKYINLVQLNIEDAVKHYAKESHIEITKTSKGMSDVFIKDLDENYLVIGRISGIDASLIFKDNETEYALKVDSSNTSDLLARVWAKEKIDRLSLQYKQNKFEINNLAKKYSIMTKDSSLIVLDRVEDYVEYEIVPPSELQKRYYELLEQKTRHSMKKDNIAIDEAVRLMEAQKSWYKKDFLAILEAQRLKKLERDKSYSDSDMFGGEEGGDVNPVVMFEQEPVAVPSPVIAAMPSSKKSVAKEEVVTSMPEEVEKKIKLKAWEPNAPYLKSIKAVKSEKQMQKYYELQEVYVKNIPFYLDMADFFYKKGQKQVALLILSNILELDFENSEYLRVFAFKLLELKFEKEAVWFFEKVVELRPFEAQASRDLALSYERVGRFQDALEKHYHILTKRWHRRFSGAKIVTINEMNHLISTQKLDAKKIDKRLIADMPVGMRIVINWSTDNSDMDLWVVDPNDEKTYYAHKESKVGGKISNDMTGGYGPEEFMLRKAIRGTYKIKVKYFASSEQNIMGETVIRAEIYTDYASGKEKREEIVFRVKEAKNVIDVGEIVY